MKVEFEPYCGIKGEEVGNALVSLFKQILGEDIISTVETYFITEDHNYEIVVKSIDNNATVSNNSSVVGIAKTIYNTRIKKSYIVIKNHQIGFLIHGLNSMRLIEFWTIEQLDALYTSIHEFGHAVDHSIRIQNYLDVLTRPFILSLVIRYYHDVIIGEVAANICITKFVPKAFKINGRSFLKDHVNLAYTELINFCQLRDGVLDEISCFNLIGYIAILILKLQEVYIHRPFENEKMLNTFDLKILNQIENWIQNLENTYPYWKSSEAKFENIILSILKDYNFEFILINNIQYLKKVS